MPILVLAAAGGLIALQCRLARQRRRWPGLVLPLACFLFSIAFCAWLAFFSQPAEGYTVRTADGLYHHFETEQQAQSFADKQTDELLEFSHITSHTSPAALWLRVAAVFLGVNLVTALFLLILWRCQKPKRIPPS